MQSKSPLWKGIRNVNINDNFRCYCDWYGWSSRLSRVVALSFFSKIPIVSFYPNTLLAIGKLQELPDTENSINGMLNTSTIKSDDLYFQSISKIIKSFYKVQDFDKIVLKRSEQFVTGYNQITQRPTFTGGESFLELLKDNKIVARFQDMYDFTNIKKELDRIARKRLAVGVIIFGLIAVLVGVLK